jgi:hypothetical protein
VRGEGRQWIAASINLASSGRNHSDQVVMLMLDAAVQGDFEAYQETRRFIVNLSLDSNVEFLAHLDAAWFFYQGEWSDPRLVDVEAGSVYRWVRVIRSWARFEVDGDVETALNRAEELQKTNEIRDLARTFEARVIMADGQSKAALQLSQQALQGLKESCRKNFQSCIWVPLAEWVSGQALSRIEGREAEGRAMLERAAEHAPNTWIATPLTQ